MRDLCVEKPRGNTKDLVTIHVMGKFSELMTGQPILNKYNGPGNPIVTIYIDDIPIRNTLINLGAAINVMTKEIFTTLGLHGLRQIPTMLGLVDRSRVKLEGVV